MEQTLEQKIERSKMIHRIHYYYADKKFCRLDMDKLEWKFDSDNPVPSSHPIIKFMLFIDDIKDRNRYQNILAEIEYHNSFEVARRIYATNKFTLEEIKQDLRERIRKLEIKIEKFHSEFCI